MVRILRVAIVSSIIVGFAVSGQAQHRGGGMGGMGGGGRAVPRGGGAIGHAAPRGAGPVGRAVPRVAGRPPGSAPYRSYAHGRYYYPFLFAPHLGLGFYYGFPGYYGYRYPYGYLGYGYGYPYYGYGYGYPNYGYGYDSGPYAGDTSGAEYGSVRIEGAPRGAEVFVDGTYVGIAGDFEGRKGLTLETGPHRVEIRAPDVEPPAVDVNVRPGQTITYHARVRPQHP